MAPKLKTPSSPKSYKGLFFGLLLVLAVLFLVAFFRARKEGFEGSTGTLLYFYMPECGHCKKFTPEWEKIQPLVDKERASLRLNKVDGTDDANKDLVRQHNVTGFPTIILEVGSDSFEYKGDRTADAVFAWAMEKMKAKPAPEAPAAPAAPKA